MMGLPNVRSCCGFCSVESGANIIAWIQLIAGMVFFAYNIESFIGIIHLPQYLYKINLIMHIALMLGLSFFPVVQGTLLLLGIRKKKAGFLLIWLIIAFTFELFLITSLALFFVALSVIFAVHKIYVVALFYGSGIQIGIAFFFIVIVSTCRKNILHRNALFDYGVLYTPEAVEILTPQRRKGLILTNSQFDYAALDTPEDNLEDVVVT